MSKNTLLKGTFILSATGILIKILGFIFRIILSRKITAVEIGTFQLTLPIITFCHAISISGFELTISKRTASLSSSEKRIKNAVQSTFFSFLCGTICCITLLFSSKLIAKYYLHNEDCEKLLSALAFSIPLSCIHSGFYSYNIGREKALFPALTQLAEQITRILILYLLTKNKNTAMSAVYATILGEVVSVCLCLLYLLSKKIKKEYFIYSPSLSKEILSLSFPVSLNRILLCGIQSVEATLIPMMLRIYGYTKSEALSSLGVITGMALPMIMFPTTFISSFSLMMIPKISKNKAYKKSLKQYTSLNLFISMLFGVFCIVFFISAGASFAALMFNNQTVKQMIRQMCIICPFIFINLTFKCMLNAIDRSYNVLFNNLLSETICLAFIVFLIPKFGITAYITGLIFSQAAGAILSIYSVKKIINN